LFYCITPTERHAKCLEIAVENGAEVNNISKEGIPVLMINLHRCLIKCFILCDNAVEQVLCTKKNNVDKIQFSVFIFKLSIIFKHTTIFTKKERKVYILNLGKILFLFNLT
jgi:hypothetical protein